MSPEELPQECQITTFYKRGTIRVILLVGPSTRVADESAGLRLALATPSWTSARLPMQTSLPVWTRRPLRQQSGPSPTMVTPVSIISIYDSSGLRIK